MVSASSTVGREPDGVGKVVDAQVAVKEGNGGTVLEAKLAVQPALRPWTEDVAPSARHLHLEEVDVFRAKPMTLPQRGYGLDGPLHIDLRGIALDVEAALDQIVALAKTLRQCRPIEVVTEERRDVALLGLEDLVVPAVAVGGQERRLDAGPPGAAGVGRLGHGSVVRKQAARARGGYPQRHRGLSSVEAQDIRGRGGGGQWAVHPRRVKAAQVPGQSRDGEALLDLPTDDERREQRSPRQFELLGQRQDGRQDAGRAMTGRDALHLIVEAVQKHTVGERGGWRVGPQGRSRDGAMGTSSERLDVAFDVTCERFRRSGERVGHAVDDDGLRRRYGRVGKLLVRRRRREFGQ